jgi:hypothetical protein
MIISKILSKILKKKLKGDIRLVNTSLSKSYPDIRNYWRNTMKEIIIIKIHLRELNIKLQTINHMDVIWIVSLYVLKMIIID